jgi:hypothetical protein
MKVCCEVNNVGCDYCEDGVLSMYVMRVTREGGILCNNKKGGGRWALKISKTFL